ncbi:MAG: DNA methyltransferase [Candidatus Methanospirare jalkutatii]|nr:DNA methyltransferase [Candidatus Methanospirare jalkutatii]
MYEQRRGKADEIMTKQLTLNEKAIEDWTFRKANTHEHIHGIHPYPARMIPQIARKLIKIYSKPDDIVLDPFCGSGGVLAEANILGRRAIGIDINPLAVLIAKVKVTPINPSKLEHCLSWINKKLKEPINPKIPKFFNLKYWFKEKTIEELSILREILSQIEDRNIRDFFYVCFSKTVIDVSLCRNKEYKLYRMPEEEIEKFNPETFKEFEENAKKAIKGMKEHCGRTSLVMLGDSRYLPLKDKSIDIIVTSPPYGDSKTTVAYGQFSRYPALWIGFNEKFVRSIDKISLGGGKRTKLSFHSETLDAVLAEIEKRNERRAKDVESYFADLGKCIMEFSRILKTNGHACIVIGNRTVSRVKIPTDRIIVEIGKEFNLEHVKTFYREIPTKKIPWANAPENIAGLKCETIKNESIIILRLIRD